MFHTFSYSNGEMKIGAKVWSDFAGHIPLIRSFSFGDNIPPQYPLFPGEPIRYHFLFYFFVGFLEKLGLRIDFALNIPSALSFTFLIVMIYFLGKTLFQSRIVGVLSVLLFLFNSSLSFLEFFKIHPISFTTLQEILANTAFPSFGPYDGKIVSAFWNLNIYTNQRHLALPLGILLLFIYCLVKYEQQKKALPFSLVLLFGLLLGALPFSHSSVFIMLGIAIGAFFLLFSRQRKMLFFALLIGIVISIPRILFLKESATFTPHLNFTYLIQEKLTILSFLKYWFFNLGLSLLLIPLGVVLSNRLAKKVFFPFLIIFAVGHSLQLSPEIAANHKFFNAFLIGGNMYSAFLFVKLWKLHLLTKPFVIIVLFSLTLSGIIDFFPIKNDRYMELADYPKNPDVAWIIENTPKNAVFLNYSYLYHPASLAGRKVFVGWPYFAWSQGYDTAPRDELRKKLFGTTDLTLFCQNARMYKISYVAIERLESGEHFTVNTTFFEKHSKKIYENSKTSFSIYDTTSACKI